MGHPQKAYRAQEKARESFDPRAIKFVTTRRQATLRCTRQSGAVVNFFPPLPFAKTARLRLRIVEHLAKQPLVFLTGLEQLSVLHADRFPIVAIVHPGEAGRVADSP